MVDWYVDKGLGTLIAQVKARFPGIVVGTIAGGSHTRTNTEHMPEADGSVDAADFMIGPHFTFANAQWLYDKLVQYRDDRLWYVIFNRHITSSETDPWKERVYSGSDPHTNHVHVSVNDKHENDKRDWKLVGLKHDKYQELDDYALPVLKYGMDDHDYDGYSAVMRAQKEMNIKADGVYGPDTAAAVKKLVGGDGRTIDLTTWVKLFGLSKREVS